MNRSLGILLLIGTGLMCVACAIGAPQTREEFVTAMRGGPPLFTGKESFVVTKEIAKSRRIAEEYKTTCLDVVTYSKRLARQAGTTTEFLSSIRPIENGGFSLVVQERYNGADLKGAPPGGMYTFVAEIIPSGKQQSRVDVFYIARRGRISEGLKTWLETETTACPRIEEIN